MRGEHVANALLLMNPSPRLSTAVRRALVSRRSTQQPTLQPGGALACSRVLAEPASEGMGGELLRWAQTGAAQEPMADASRL